MYFIMKGRWSFAKEIINPTPQHKSVQINSKHYIILKEYEKPTYIGEYYVLTLSRSSYCYIANENVDAYALNRTFLDSLFSKYP